MQEFIGCIVEVTANLRVRQRPSLDAKITDYLEPGTRFKVLEESGAWVKATGTGWVGKKYLRIVDVSPTPPPPTPQPQPFKLGCDVSHWNPAPNWPVARAAGLEYVGVKATDGLMRYGSMFTDDKFLTHWAGATAAGLRCVAYHYFRPDVDALRQANHFLRVIAGAPKPYGVALDVEEVSNISPAEYTRALLVWLDAVEKTTDLTPLFYTRKTLLDMEAEQTGQFTRYPLWVAQYGVEASAVQVPRDWQNVGWRWWQHTGTGRTPWADGDIDLNWIKE